MSKYEPVEVVAPEGVTFTDGPFGPRASDGKEYTTYSFGMFDVPPDELDASKKKLADFYQRWLNGFCAGFGVTQIEWRTHPDIAVLTKAKSKKKLSDLRVYSRFHAPEAHAQQNQAMDVIASWGPLQ